MSIGEYLRKRVRIIPWLVVGGLAMTLITCRTCLTSFHYFASVSALTISSWMLMWFGTEYLCEYLDERIKWTTHPVQRVIAGFVLILLYTVIAIYLLTTTAQWVFDINIGSVTETIFIGIGITLVITVLLTSRSFLFNWRQTAIDAEKFKRESTIAKFESLRNQVNPHFLFNSFNVLTNLVYEDQDKAAKFIKQLSDVYRYLLDMSDKEIVTVAEEKRFLASYLFLQQIRFGDKLKLTLTLDGGEGMIPPLVLQMLVENANKHNEISEEHPLSINIYTDGNFIVVENDIRKKNIVTESSPGVGLDNICERYKFLTDKNVEIIEDKKFKVKLPIIATTI
jgi:LytS/YehU family sensor histidine kinase